MIWEGVLSRLANTRQNAIEDSLKNPQSISYSFIKLLN